MVLDEWDSNLTGENRTLDSHFQPGTKRAVITSVGFSLLITYHLGFSQVSNH